MVLAICVGWSGALNNVVAIAPLASMVPTPMVHVATIQDMAQDVSTRRSFVNPAV